MPSTRPETMEFFSFTRVLEDPIVSKALHTNSFTLKISYTN